MELATDTTIRMPLDERAEVSVEFKNGIGTFEYIPQKIENRTMFTAQEARERATNSSNAKVNAQLNKIQSEIEKAVKEAKYSCSMYEKLLDGVELKLKELGYNCKEEYSRDPAKGAGYWVTISW